MSAFFLVLFLSNIGFAQTQTYNSNGTFIVPAGVTSINVELWGGGAAGSNRGGAAGGGGGGAYTKATLTGLTPGSTLNVTVGRGGTVSGTQATTNGGNSSVNTVVANGGSTVINSRDGGAGGQASPLTGGVTASFDGGDGGNARSGTNSNNNEAGGGGGGSAFTTGSGNNGSNGASSTSAVTAGGTGTGNGGGGAAADGNPGAVAGSAPGGGGGGRGEGTSTSQNGASGRVIISYTCPTNYRITSVNVGSVCQNGSATVTVSNTTPANLPVGNYTVSYTLGAPNAITTTATMDVSVAGTGTFTTGNLSGIGTTSIVINSLSSGRGFTDVLCSNNLTSGNTGSFSVLPAIAISTQPAASMTMCAGTGSQTLSVAATGSNLTFSWRKNGTALVNNAVISGQGTNQLTIANPSTTDSGSYDVIINNACNASVTSSVSVLTVNPAPTDVTANASATTVCASGTVNLTSNANSNSGPTNVVLLNENFNDATNNWTRTNTSSGGTPADAAWTLRQNGYVYSSVTFNSNDNTQFYLTNSDDQGSGSNTLTTLTSPSFSTVGLASANFSFYHYYRSLTGQTGLVRVSTNGTNWTNLQSFTTDIGSSTGFVQQVVDLSNYLGQATVYIRFEFTSSYGWYWAIDNVSVSGISSTSSTPAYAWSSSPPGFSATAQNPTNVSVSATTVFTVTATNNFGCSASASTPAVSISTQSTTWSGTAWSDGEPTALKNIIITGNYNSPGSQNNLVGCSLTVQNNATVIINPQDSVILSGALTVAPGCNVTFESLANLIQTGEGNLNSGVINFKAQTSPLKRLDYTLWSSPVSGTQTLQAFSPNTLSNRFYTYDANTSFYVTVPTPASTLFETAKGYLIRVANNHSASEPQPWMATFIGTPNSGNYTIPLADFGAGKRFNLVGNPYPSPIDPELFLTNPNNAGAITGTIYLWRKTNGASGPAYCTLNLGGFVSNGNARANQVAQLPEKFLQSGQGFFVEGTGSGSGTVVFNNAMRVDDHVNTFLRTTNTVQSSETEKNRIWLNVTNEAGAFSQTLVGYVSNATNGIDLNYDGKFINDGEISITSILEDTPYAIQSKGLPFAETDVVQLQFKATNPGTYTIAIDHVDGIFSDGQNVYLRDNLTTTVHNLTDSAYDFTSDAGTFTTRFELLYQSGTLGVNNPEFTENQVVIYKTPTNELSINTGNFAMDHVMVYDVSGRLLTEVKNINNTQTLLKVDFTAEVLLVKIKTQDGKTVSKKVLFPRTSLKKDVKVNANTQLAEDE